MISQKEIREKQNINMKNANGIHKQKDCNLFKVIAF